MKAQLEQIRAAALAAIAEAADGKAVEELRVKYLGKTRPSANIPITNGMITYPETLIFDNIGFKK